MAKLKLTDERVNTVLGLIARGSTDQAACEAAGLTPQHFTAGPERGKLRVQGCTASFSTI